MVGLPYEALTAKPWGESESSRGYDGGGKGYGNSLDEMVRYYKEQKGLSFDEALKETLAQTRRSTSEFSSKANQQQPQGGPRPGSWIMPQQQIEVPMLSTGYTSNFAVDPIHYGLTPENQWNDFWKGWTPAEGSWQQYKAKEAAWEADQQMWRDLYKAQNAHRWGNGQAASFPQRTTDQHMAQSEWDQMPASSSARLYPMITR